MNDTALLTMTVISDQFLSHLDDGFLRRWLESQLPSFLSIAWSVILAFVIYGIGIHVIRWLLVLLRKAMTLRNIEQGVIQFTISLSRGGLYFILFVIILQLFGVTTSSIAAAIASIGLTAGFALQGALANFAGGVLILLLKPFVVGDYIIEDTHKNEGTVIQITIFYTKLRTIDNKVILVPNGTLANSSMTNYTHADMRVIDLVASIGYGDDLVAAKEVLRQIANDDPDRLASEPVNVFVHELGESSVDLGLRFWVPTEKYWAARWRTLEEIKLRFDAHGITIPFNQMDVHVVPAEAAATKS